MVSLKFNVGLTVSMVLLILLTMFIINNAVTSAYLLIIVIFQYLHVSVSLTFAIIKYRGI